MIVSKVVDVVEEGFGAAIRIGSLLDSRLIARTIKQLRFITVASPNYLYDRGAPKTLSDLLEHNCLTVKGPETGRRTKWRYRVDKKDRHIAVDGNMTVDTADVLLEVALSGLGVVQIMDFAVEPYLANGELVEVLVM